MSEPDVTLERPCKAMRGDSSACDSHQQAAQEPPRDPSGAAADPPAPVQLVPVKKELGVEPAVFKRLKDLKGVVLDINSDSD